MPAVLDLQSGFGDLCAETDETLMGPYFATFAARERQREANAKKNSKKWPKATFSIHSIRRCH